MTVATMLKISKIKDFYIIEIMYNIIHKPRTEQLSYSRIVIISSYY